MGRDGWSVGRQTENTAHAAAERWKGPTKEGRALLVHLRVELVRGDAVDVQQPVLLGHAEAHAVGNKLDRLRDAKVCESEGRSGRLEGSTTRPAKKLTVDVERER